jgi:hypothetical protein
MSKKYRCMGGYITSRSDGDRHYISAHKVAELYGVSPAECIFVDIDDSTEKTKGYHPDFIESMVTLWPRDSGNYELPKEELDK